MSRGPEPLCFVVTRRFRWLAENVVRGLGGAFDALVFEADQAPDVAALQRRLQDEPLRAVVFVTHHVFRFVRAEAVIALAGQRGAPSLVWNVDSAPMIHDHVPPAARVLPVLHVSELDLACWTRLLVPGATGSWTRGIGPHPAASAQGQAAAPLAERPIACLLPINLRWCGIGLAELERRIEVALPPPLRALLDEVVEEGRRELSSHPAFAVEQRLAGLGLEDARLRLVLVRFAVARIQLLRRHDLVRACLRHPVHVNVDELPPELLATPGIRAELSRTGTQQDSLRRMAASQSVISISFVNDLPHDRFYNALEVGSVPVVEDNAAYRATGLGPERLVAYDFEAGSLDRVLEEVCAGKLDLPGRSRSLAAALEARPLALRFEEFVRLADAGNADR